MLWKKKKHNKFNFHNFSLIFMCLAVCVMVLSIVGMFASQGYWHLVTYGGKINFYAEGDNEIYVEPTPEEIEQGNECLNNGGFDVQPEEEGGPAVILGTGRPSDKPVDIMARHNSLIGKDSSGHVIDGVRPILRYVQYTNSLCDVNNVIIGVLDFSRTNVEVFGESFLSGMQKAIFGDSGKVTYTETLYICDSATGQITTKNISLPSAVMQGNRMNVAIRVILPNYARVQGRNVIFREGSLSLGHQGNVSKYSFIELDCSQLDLIRDAQTHSVQGLELSSALVDNTSELHLHLIVEESKKEQQALAFEYALNYVSDSAIQVVCDLFVRGYSEQNRLLSLALRAESFSLTNNEITVFSKPEADEDFDTLQQEEHERIVSSIWFLHKTGEINGRNYLNATYNYCTRRLNNTIGVSFPITIYQQDTTIGGISYRAGDIYCNEQYSGNYLDYNSQNGYFD